MPCCTPADAAIAVFCGGYLGAITYCAVQLFRSQMAEGRWRYPGASSKYGAHAHAPMPTAGAAAAELTQPLMEPAAACAQPPKSYSRGDVVWERRWVMEAEP